jgi:hypothetical protein
MKVTLQQAEVIMKENLAFSQLAFSLLVTRLKTLYAKSPSEATLQNCSDEINKFLGKFEKVMAKDYSIIEKL